MSNTQPVQWELLERMFSYERLRQYLEKTFENKAKAEELYVWNNQIRAMSRYIDPEFGNWLDQRSRVRKILLAYPNSSGIVAP